MGNVLYEVHYQLRLANLIPVFIIIFLILYIKRQSVRRVIKTSLCAAGIVIMALLLVGLIEVDIVNNSKLVRAYKRSEYKTVQGYVENFVPESPQGHDFESFEIDNVCFRYSNNCLSSGYCITKSHGGVLHHNGQYLKIGYVETNTVYGNIIVYIEEIPSKANNHYSFPDVVPSSTPTIAAATSSLRSVAV